MKYVNERNDTPHQRKENKKPVGWPDYFGWMVVVARKLVGSNDAEDIANAALYDAFCSNRPRPSIENEAEVKRLLRCLLTFRALDHWKKTKNRRRLEAPLVVDVENEVGEFFTAHRTDVMLDRLALDQTLATLEPLDRQLVIAYCVEGFTAAELAEKYAMNESTVRSRIARTLTNVAEALDYRHGKTNWALLMCLPVKPGHAGSLARRAFDAMGKWLSNVTIKLRFVTAHIGSVALSAVALSDAPDINRPMVGMDDGETAFITPVEVQLAPVSPMSEIQRVVAPPYMREQGQRPRRPPLPVTMKRAETKVEPPPDVDVAPVSARFLEDPYAAKQTTSAQCAQAFTRAAASFSRDDAKECISILNDHRNGSGKCVKTPEWLRLRLACVNAIRENAP